ncbi:class B sortase [Mobilitalea sibirica]|uniref:Class B sortase n=1 Tax=Mobilitalea sibirica TaxID=1462919 RepID=A0A8J7H8F1_9FIRM|nr:class B sortase [Mobilitalea sibirica]MBH1941491.1 class B sortase [Mobilitalea sibirica]
MSEDKNIINGSNDKELNDANQSSHEVDHNDSEKETITEISKGIEQASQSIANEDSSEIVNENNTPDPYDENMINDEYIIQEEHKDQVTTDQKTIDQSILDQEASDDITDTQTSKDIKKKIDIFKILRIAFTLGFIVFAALFINEVFVQPYRSNKLAEEARSLYKRPDPTPTLAITPAISDQNDSKDDLSEESSSDTNKTSTKNATPTSDPNRDQYGRLISFKPLLDENSDIKGWINVPGTNIDYPVMQSSNGEPEYYLDKGWDGRYLKAGSLFLDYKSSVEKNSQNLVIHGHNMTSSNDMFHHLLKYKKLEFIKENPVFTFDTIYHTGEWKIFAYVITNGSTKKEELFNYTRSEFKNSSDFLNFIYQLRIRSIYHIDDVDINENDQIVTLSTCSYEVKDYRTVIVARKVREGEDATVDTESIVENPEPLYPYSFYYRYGGKAPKLKETFEEALEAGEINWYKPVEE